MQHIRSTDTFSLEFNKEKVGIDIYVPNNEYSRYSYIGFFDVTKVRGYPLIPEFMIQKLEDNAPDDFNLLELTNEMFDMMTEAQEEGLY